MKLQLSELANKHNTNQLPEVFYNYFRDISTIHNYEKRSKTNKYLFLPRVNLNYGQFGVKCAAVKTWNESPNEIRVSKSTKVFKCAAVKTWNESPNEIGVSKSTKVFRKKYKDFLLSQ